jgi:hypothetical protein
MDSVMASLIIRERSMNNLPVMPHDYLMEAEGAGAGVFELAESPGELKRIAYEELRLT